MKACLETKEEVEGTVQQAVGVGLQVNHTNGSEIIEILNAGGETIYKALAKSDGAYIVRYDPESFKEKDYETI